LQIVVYDRCVVERLARRAKRRSVSGERSAGSPRRQAAEWPVAAYRLYPSDIVPCHAKESAPDKWSKAPPKFASSSRASTIDGDAGIELPPRCSVGFGPQASSALLTSRFSLTIRPDPEQCYLAAHDGATWNIRIVPRGPRSHEESTELVPQRQTPSMQRRRGRARSAETTIMHISTASPSETWQKLVALYIGLELTSGG
jgi:hypothetical protein